MKRLTPAQKERHAGGRKPPAAGPGSVVKVLDPRREGLRGWYAKVEVSGSVYFVGVERGNRVRIPYKPRGAGAYGFQHWGLVRDAQAKPLFYDRVPGSLGIRGLLRAAGVLPITEEKS